MAPTTLLPKLSDATQTISFSDGDGVCSAEVFSTNVLVNTNAGNHDHGSSKVKLKNLVDYNWEPKFYSGQLLAIHTSGKYLAYCIKAPNPVNPGTWSGMVRVVYTPEPGTDRRALIKGMKGEVQDLAFAHIQNQVVLACIDEQGNFYVHEIEVTDGGLRCTLLAEVREDTGAVGTSHRVVWCPYIPDDEDEAPDDDVARLLLTTHDNIGMKCFTLLLTRMWNTRGLSGSVLASARVGGAGALCAAEHVAAILDAAFSPDGSALATASADGYVMFFQINKEIPYPCVQVYMHADSSPRCLHKWQPHGGKPLSCLFFLDNHKNYNTDVQFWKFAVTGAENNTTIKIWSCKSWTCLQTISFTPGLGTEASLGLKAMLDTSASYLLLSDFKSRSLYVLHMARDPEDTMAYCKSISEFLLPYPVLSFCIVDADIPTTCTIFYYYKHECIVAGVPMMMMLTCDQEEGSGECSAECARVSVRLYIVQPKGLQEGRLVYTPPRPPLHADLMHEL
uniref:SFRICE_027362 n=1 Tax=Spodoptera frugiperda TaxID=7108 RepID=A0A2H1VPN5_SPOFR